MIVESAIGAHLLNSALTNGFMLNYWREGNQEVDFVLKKKDKIVALEVKTNIISITEGMTMFEKKHPPR